MILDSSDQVESSYVGFCCDCRKGNASSLVLFLSLTSNFDGCCCFAVDTTIRGKLNKESRIGVKKEDGDGEEDLLVFVLIVDGDDVVERSGEKGDFRSIFLC